MVTPVFGSRLMDVLVDSREVLRNEALLLLIQLTKGNANLQKIVAFENAFDKIVDIIELEGYSDGGIVVEDCLKLMLNLLRNNSSNQTFFRYQSRYKAYVTGVKWGPPWVALSCGTKYVVISAVRDAFCVDYFTLQGG